MQWGRWGVMQCPIVQCVEVLWSATPGRSQGRWAQVEWEQHSGERSKYLSRMSRENKALKDNQIVPGGDKW